jgi:hypothetical protein
VTVKAFAVIEHGHLELLVRVPLAAVKDVQFPTRGDAGNLDVAAVRSMLTGTARHWIAPCFSVFENGMLLSPPEISGTRLSLNADRSFDSYAGALARFTAPDLSEEDVFWDQVWLDSRFQYPLHPDRSGISIVPQVAGLGVNVSTLLDYVRPDGSLHTFTFEGDPGLIYLDPRWTDAGRQFLRAGVNMVGRNGEVLLFLFCLALPFRRYRHFMPAVIAFVAALGLGLATQALELAPAALWFRPLIETTAAAAVLLVALANVAGHVTPRNRALFALAAGFIFGFTCAFRLGALMQFGGTHHAVAAGTFYVGILVATAGVAIAVIPLLSFLFSLARAEQIERIIVSALAADTSWGWLSERWAELRKISFHPSLDADTLALTLRCLAVLVVLAGLAWFVNEWFESRTFADENLTVQGNHPTTA